MRYFLIFLFSVLTLSLTAQDTYVLTGFVKDHHSKPIEGATIRAFTPDSIFISGIATNAKGFFTLPLPRRKCFIEVACLGYKKHYQHISIGRHAKEYHADTIRLQEQDVRLNEVTVTGTAAAMKMRGDTLEYNARIYTLSEQATVRDLLKLLPNVTVTDKGQILVQGKAVSKILVDGKEFFASDPDMASKSLPGKIVDKVQVIEQGSEASRLTGFESGEKETILNLAIKEENQTGVMALASAGGGHDIDGSKARYEHNGYLNVLKKDDLFNLNLQNDNTNSGIGYLYSGENTTNRIGISANKGFSKQFSLSGDANYSTTKTNEHVTTEKQTILSPESSQYDNLSNASLNKSKSLNMSVKSEWNPTEQHTLLARVNLNYQQNDRQGNDRFDCLSNLRDTLYKGSTATDDYGKSHSIHATIDYAYRFKKKGRVLSTSITGSTGRGNSHAFSSWEYQMFEANRFQRDSLLNRQTDNKDSNRQFRSFLSYVEPVAENRFVQFAYTLATAGSYLDRYTYDIEAYGQPGESLSPVPEQSPESRQHTVDQRFTVNYKAVGKQTEYTLGMSMDLNNAANETTLPDHSARPDVKQQVTNYSPVLNVKHKFNTSNTLRFDYTGMMTSPTTSQLQDYTDSNNPTNSIKGNPNLKPEFNHNAALVLYGSDLQTQSTYNAYLRGQYTTNAIQPVLRIDPNTGNRITSYQNIAGNWNANLQLIYSTPIKNTPLKISNLLNCGYNRRKGIINDAPTSNGTFVVEENMNLNYLTPNLEIMFSGSYKLMALHGLNNTQEPKTQDLETELSVSYLLPWKLRLNPSFRWSLKKGYAASGDIRQNLLNVRLSRDCFSKKYGAGTIRLEGFDLLQSSKQLTRNTGATYIENITTSTMGSYFLCSFIYSFNFFP